MTTSPPRSIHTRLSSILVWLIKSSKGQRKRIVWNTWTGIGKIFCGLAFIWFSKRIIDTATGHLNSSIPYESIGLCSALVLQTLFHALSTRIDLLSSTDIAHTLRLQLLDRLLRSHWSDLQAFHTGDIVNRLECDTQRVASLLAQSIPSLLISCTQLTAALIFLYWLDPRLACGILILIPFSILLGKAYIKRIQAQTHDIRESDSRIQSITQESVQHHTLIRTLEETPHRIALLNRQQQLRRTRLLRRNRFAILSRSLLSLGFGTIYLAVFLWGSIQLSESLIGFGTMAAFLQLVGQIQNPAYSLSRLLPEIAAACTSAERLMELEKIPLEAENSPASPTGIPEIRIENVSFRYHDLHGETAVFHHRSLVFPPGSMIALYGESGIGKTTLVRLLLALTTPEEGRLYLVEKGRIQELSPSTRPYFSYVPQENSIFSGSIRDNLLMGNPQATEADMLQALQLAEAHFVDSLPRQIDTCLGEHGHGLSEGQAQRIAIARSLLRPSPVLIFDEATSALDADTEQRLIQNLRNTYRLKKTMLFITHHDRLARMCDQSIQI